MKFYTCKVTTATDGTETRDLRSFDDLDSALNRYFGDLAKVVNVSGYASILMMIIDDEGGTRRREKWIAPTTTTEETTES